MRIIPALLGALLITLAVFLFMHSLIQRGKEEGVPVVVYNDVQILQQEPEEPPPEEQEPEAEPEEMEEPSMEPLAVATVSPAAPVPADTLEIPALDLAAGDLNIAAAGKRWTAPVGGGGGEVVVGGKDVQGYVEVVPFDTRRPNVPEVAWQNKIDGWVLVAFSVTAQGRTRDVRVLDASPRGVFEEKVIAAVEDWTYRISFSGDLKGDVILTQKVEVQWQNFPQNLPNVD
ncbi:MAG: TonB family protein [Halioglobus sp.]|nr:TonB family protein [Halioglobus sp.]